MTESTPNSCYTKFLKLAIQGYNLFAFVLLIPMFIEATCYKTIDNNHKKLTGTTVAKATAFLVVTLSSTRSILLNPANDAATFSPPAVIAGDWDSNRVSRELANTLNVRVLAKQTGKGGS
ncbi:hypothetical protein GQ44DRAFT_729994 [Phaeosphaeriaceae sp. PMI808]|nr:hypothetical protein GQ44DRAFT_729994 [Phaeosphaeriaceae sp. PMI808]